MKNILLFHKIPLAITLLAWLWVGWALGPTAFFLVIVLSILEITLSADNAVVNSRVLVKMSELWQKLFLTVGIFIAVFLIRFILPIAIVAVAIGMSMSDVTMLAINHPDEYGEKLHQVAPIIDGFGGMFLFMVAAFFFVNISRSHFWIKDAERFLSRFAKVPHIKIAVIALLYISIITLLPQDLKIPVGISMGLAIFIYTLLHTVTVLMERLKKSNEAKKQVGWVAFGSFLYLEVLDASFSLDGVVGAFALTNNIVIIMVGLGIGALWVRTLTLHMVKNDVLGQYKFLESGAHWAILFLSMIMFLKLFHIELPEVVVGLVGLVCIVASIYSSARRRKRLS